MGLFGKNKDGKSGERRNILKNAMRSSDLKVAVSHADLEGMLSTIGVIAALVLSIQVGVFCTIPQEEMALADYRIALIEVPPFRAYALSILEKLDDPPFKFEVDVGQDTPFDIRAALQTEYVCISAIDGGGTTCYDPENKAIIDIDTVYHLTSDIFPLKLVVPYFYHTAGSTAYLLSDGLYDKWSAYSIVILTLVLIGSLLFYTSLAFSDCQEESEEGNTKPLEYFNIIAMPVIFFAYLALFAGIVFFFFSYCLLFGIRAPSYKVVMHSSNFWMYQIMMPSFGLLVISSMVALLISNYSRRLDSMKETMKSRVFKKLKGGKEDKKESDNENVVDDDEDEDDRDFDINDEAGKPRSGTFVRENPMNAGGAL